MRSPASALVTITPSSRPRVSTTTCRAPEYDFDGRNSIAVPIRLHGEVLGCVNVTWRKTVMSAQEAARRHLDDLQAAVHRIEERASAAAPQRLALGGDEI